MFFRQLLIAGSAKLFTHQRVKLTERLNTFPLTRNIRSVVNRLTLLQKSLPIRSLIRFIARLTCRSLSSGPSILMDRANRLGPLFPPSFPRLARGKRKSRSETRDQRGIF